MKALSLVKKVAAIASTARERHGRDGRDLARSGMVRLIRVSTVMARQLQRVPMPKPRPAEQVVLSAAASNLRAIARATGALDAALDPESPEGALSELVSETLALVDKMLAGTPEIPAREANRELPSATSEGDDAPTKVSF